MASIYGVSWIWSVTTPTTNLGTWQQLAIMDGLLEFTRAVGTANLIGATGGTLDIVIQTNYARGSPGQSVPGGGQGAGFWKDIGRFNTLASGAVAASFGVVFTRGLGGTLTVPTAANTTDGTPLIAVNTLVPQQLGDALRLMINPGVGTTSGATLTFAFDAI